MVETAQTSVRYFYAFAARFGAGHYRGRYEGEEGSCVGRLSRVVGFSIWRGSTLSHLASVQALQCL